MDSPNFPRVAVIGAGAAGVFAAIHLKELIPLSSIDLLEATQRPLSKLKISGGGRCNVTHHCFDPKELIKAYPRGSKELLQVFHRFGPKDTIEWFQARGVSLVVEKDGRMFPSTNSSQTIIDCLMNEVLKTEVNLKLGFSCQNMSKAEDGRFIITTKQQEQFVYDRVLMATGSSPLGYKLISDLNLPFVAPKPSLFTFQIKAPLLEGLMGVAFSEASCVLKVAGKTFEQKGPVLITHWGLSGPAVLKLSAFAARELFDASYSADLMVNFIPSFTRESFFQKFLEEKKQHPGRKAVKDFFLSLLLPRRFIERVFELLNLEEKSYHDLSKSDGQALYSFFASAQMRVSGKGVFKDEFVTSGGLSRKEIDFKTMESKTCKGLFFAGEALDIDGITGGFNFQNAWSTAYIAAHGISCSF